MAIWSTRIAASGDDFIVQPAFFAFDATFSSFRIAGSFSAYGKWNNVTIPAGSTINSAVVSLTARGSWSGTPANSTWYGHDTDSATAPTNFAGWTALVKTTASVAWNSIAAWTDNVVYDSPDLATIVQEIIDRGGWASGNNLALTWEGASGSDTRSGDSYDGSSADAPLLTIDYTEAVAGGLANLTQSILLKPNLIGGALIQ